MEQCGLAQNNKLIVTVDDNDACIASIGVGFIKTYRIKPICPQLFRFTQDLIQSEQIEVKKADLTHN